MIEYVESHRMTTFEQVHSSLAVMVERDPHGAEAHIRGVLRNLYVNQGLDWTGRGMVCDAGLEASIAAHECILAELSYRHNGGKGVADERQT